MPDPISWSAAAPYLIGFFIFGYLSGTFPSGLIFARLSGKGDIRKIGSGNIGATNALRTGSKLLAFATLVGDAFKGFIPVIIGFQYGGPDGAVLAGLGAFLGHLFPIWLNFRGGKGIATYLGLILAFVPLVALAFIVIWLLCAFITRYSSLSALMATLATPLIMYQMGHVQFSQLFALLTILAWAMHHQNIRRLINKTEGKIGQKG